MMKLLRKLRRSFSIDLKGQKRKVEVPESDLDRIWMSLVASVSLAHRGVAPQTLMDTNVGSFMVGYCGGAGLKQPQADGTKFGLTCTTWIKQHSNHPFIEGNLSALIKIFTEISEDAGLAHSLALGWFQQCLIKATTLEKKFRDGHLVRAEPHDLRLLTQWFTPEWIAEFLVEQSIETNANAAFFDPACGAGHLLVPALERLWALSDKTEQRLLKLSDAAPEQVCESSDAAQHRMRIILERQLFGADIDSKLIDVAKFSIYLKTLDLVGIAELPEPRIVLIGSETDGIGSLRLGTNKPSMAGDSSFPALFDAIAMNPPYLGHRTMPQSVRNFLKIEYPDSQYDLFAAFLELGIRLLKPNCRLSAICQQSVLTIQRYEQLRGSIQNVATIESLVQLGSGTFATKGGEKTNNAIVTFRKKPSKLSNPVACWQLLSRADKDRAELEGIYSVPHKTISRASAEAIAEQLPSSPFAYWAPNEILQLFKKFPALMTNGNGITCTNGLFTCNNEKFVRRFDEVPEASKHEFVSYDKGGGHKWFRTSDLMLHWKGDGSEIRDYRKKRGQSTKLPGEAHYFKPGLTYSYIGTRGFKARLLSPNSVFDIASSAIFSDSVSLNYLLGLLNSSLTRCILGVLNPTINFQIGDIRRLPFQHPSTTVEHAVSMLVSEAVALAQEVEKCDPTSPMFAKNAEAREVENWIERERSIQNEIDEIIFDFHDVSIDCRSQILADPWVTRGSEPFARAAAGHFSNT